LANDKLKKLKGKTESTGKQKRKNNSSKHLKGRFYLVFASKAGTTQFRQLTLAVAPGDQFFTFIALISQAAHLVMEYNN
jgi:hypothetical protein